MTVRQIRNDFVDASAKCRRAVLAFLSLFDATDHVRRIVLDGRTTLTIDGALCVGSITYCDDHPTRVTLRKAK